MLPIQADLTDEALITAIRANLCDFYRHLGSNNPAGYFANERFIRWHTIVPHPWFNGVLSLQPPTKEDDAFIRETIQYFHKNDVGVFTWWVEPPMPAAEWEPPLIHHGFGFSDDTPGMAVDLHTLNESVQEVDGLEIRSVEDEESLRTWSHVFTNGYGLPENWEPMIHEGWLNLGLDLPMRNYIGYLNGKPVSTSCLFLGGGVAGVYSVSTLSEARGKGIGAAITLKPLQDARAMGYRVGTLQSSDMGFNIYKKLGFRHLCQIENFYLSIK